MPDTKPRTPKAPRPEPVKADPKTTSVDRKRAAHVLGLPGEDGALVEVELFTGELAARRALDERPEWKYLHLIPGQKYRARHVIANEGDA